MNDIHEQSFAPNAYQRPGPPLFTKVQCTGVGSVAATPCSVILGAAVIIDFAKGA
jgi:hypothetical protein